MSEKVLRDRCKINTNIDTDTFVGVKGEAGDITVNFPLGFHLSDDDKSLKKEILLLLNVLYKNTDKRESTINSKASYNDVTLPIQAFLYVISDYYTRGYYKESETIYETAKRGKIHWGRTVKQQKTFIQNDDIYYLDFTVKKNSVSQNELITLIHEFCVYESFDKIGWLFTAYMPDKPRIKYNPKLFKTIIKKKLSETFDDRNRLLFKNLIAIIDSLGDDGPVENFKYGTYRFEYIWEKMIDKAYGIKNKADYFPKTKWALEDKTHDNASLEPDTIMLTSNAIYVLDSKYYKFGWSKAPGHLPESTSINKQITYGEYIAETEKFLDENGNHPTVYNAFLMPYDSFGETFHTEKELHYVGSAISDWKSSDGTKPYEQVAGILVDVKSLMQNYSHDEDRIIRLAELIESSIINK